MTEVDALTRKTDRQLGIHEAVCAERYSSIEAAFVAGAARMQRIEYILYLVAALSLLGSTHLGELFKQIIVK